MIDWDDVKIFHAAVRSGDYTSAARTLRMDRTTVGRRVARLESRLGAAVWSLAGDGYRPTALGRELLAIAETMESSLAALAQSKADRSVIRLTGTAGLAELVVPLLGKTLREQQGLTIETIAAPNAAVAVQARSADLGLAIARALPPGTRGDRAVEYRQARYTAIDDRQDDRRVSWSHATMLANPFAWAKLNAPDDTTACEVAGIPAMVAAVAAGLGTAWLWDAVGDGDPRLRRLPDPIPAAAIGDVWIVHRADMAPSASVTALRIALADVLSNLQPTSVFSRIASPAAR